VARIYTRTGDGGETSLFDGTRVAKSAPRVDLYGSVDELNSALGLALAWLVPVTDPPAGTDRTDGVRDPDLLSAMLMRIQADLLEVGAVLAHPERSRELREAGPEAVPFAAIQLERDIDRLQEELPELKSFVLPGGTATAAALHLARTVCRRVERQAVQLARQEDIPRQVLIYLNRLSDFCFVAARWANRRDGRNDVVWQSRC
jgi:cob(I)alamin adenosyltransferase